MARLIYFCKVPLQQGILWIYTFFVSEGDSGVPDVMYPSSLSRTESVTLDIEGNENKMTRSIDFIIQSCSNFQGICTRYHIMKCFLFEQNHFSHLNVTAKYSSVAFRLPLGVFLSFWFMFQPWNDTRNTHHNVVISTDVHGVNDFKNTNRKRSSAVTVIQIRRVCGDNSRFLHETHVVGTR